MTQSEAPDDAGKVRQSRRTNNEAVIVRQRESMRIAFSFLRDGITGESSDGTDLASRMISLTATQRFNVKQVAVEAM